MKKTSSQQDVQTSLHTTFTIKCCRSRITASKGTFPWPFTDPSQWPFESFNHLSHLPLFYGLHRPCCSKSNLAIAFSKLRFMFLKFLYPRTILQKGAKENPKNRSKRGEAGPTTAPNDRLYPVVSSKFKKPRNMASSNKRSVKMEFYNYQTIRKLQNPTALKGRAEDSFTFLK